MADAIPPRSETDRSDARSDEARLGPLDDFIGFHLRLAQEASFRAFAARVGDPDLKPRRFAVLTLIAENPGMTQTALGKAAGRDKSTLTTTLDDLVKRGLVSRERAPNDRRSYTLFLTDKGCALHQKLMAAARAHDADLDRLVGPENKALFLALLRRIACELG
ncbi:MarR family winged helix-turn-helix transcriptional regulator [Phreatobacter oligotrophus]|jgi:DNA-binding MarR family transcriptional regulator|uniref:MarR family transcriptional regulator n=1 Tax=Phreatobacter oligotrophus TaxID=1122261 RepID=A0A2T4ZGG7_9HYPH|nr:MarR family transcriptional regulator [Phreatobacter oligotrophus]PTM61004.1 MarR family transcriptional regulator [Phreatobacter oligotrophus]